MTQRILFVCLGNICRSPSAEGVARHMAAERGLDLEIDSAGTGDWHVGAPPYGPMQQAAQARGYDLSGLRARQATAQDFTRYDLILAMDDDNHRDLARIMPATATARLARFAEYLGPDDPDHVPDPYYTRDFDHTLDIVERGVGKLLGSLR